jgi:uncharacterized protein (DUF1684 family)
MQEPALSHELDPEAHEQQVHAWRNARVGRLTAPDSWLSLIGKHFIEPGVSSVGSHPQNHIVLPEERAPAQLGTFTLREGAVTFEPAKGAVPRLRTRAGEERSLQGPTPLTTDAHGTPDKILLGSLSLEVMERAGAFAVRVRDSESPRRAAFQGIQYYPIEPTLRVVAQLEPYSPAKPIELAYDTGNAELKHAPFAAVFEREGKTVRLDLVPEGPQRFFLLFWDQTCRSESYGAGRFLYAAPPRGDRIVLDFNQAFSPPCAFTPFAACPLPPPQNRVQLALRAGEKAPAESSDLPTS